MSLFSNGCMPELKFAIYHRAASLSNSAILHNDYISLLSDLCTCVHVKKKWRRKGSHSSSVSGLNHHVRLQIWKKATDWCTAQWKMLLFCAKTIAKESRKFQLARLEKKRRRRRRRRRRYSIYYASVLSLHIESTSSLIWKLCTFLTFH